MKTHFFLNRDSLSPALREHKYILNYLRADHLHTYCGCVPLFYSKGEGEMQLCNIHEGKLKESKGNLNLPLISVLVPENEFEEMRNDYNRR